MISDFDFSHTVPSTTDGSERPVGTSEFTVIYDRNYAGYTSPNGSNFSRISDATAPSSAPDVWRLYFPAGNYSDGHSSGNIGRAFPSNVNEVYVSLWIKWSSNWQWHQISTKFLRFCNGNLLIHALNNGRWLYADSNLLAQNYADPGADNYVNAPLQTGVWNQIEIQIRSGNPGVLKVWVNGHLRINSTKAVPTLQTFSIDGYLGGGGMNQTADMNYVMDHLFIATR